MTPGKIQSSKTFSVFSMVDDGAIKIDSMKIQEPACQNVTVTDLDVIR